MVFLSSPAGLADPRQRRKHSLAGRGRSPAIRGVATFGRKKRARRTRDRYIVPMPNCQECGGIEIHGQIAHKPGCKSKPKPAASVCPECGGPTTLRGTQHQPGRSKSPKKQVLDFLARPIGIVCKASQPNVLPMHSYSPAQGHIQMPSGKDLLQAPAATGAAVPAVGDQMAERLLSALASIENANQVAVRAIIDRMTIRDFRALAERQQLDFINSLWNATCTSHAFNMRGD